MIEFSIVIVSYYNIPMVVECIESIIKYKASAMVIIEVLNWHKVNIYYF